MAFLLRKPFIFIIISVVLVVLVIQLSGVFAPKPTVVITPSLASSSISMNKNTTLTVIIENKASRPYSVEYHIVGRFNTSQLRFYDKINSAPLPDPVWNGNNYTITYPKVWDMDTGARLNVSVLVKGLDPGINDITYPIFVEVWTDKILVERKSVQLTVKHP